MPIKYLLGPGWCVNVGTVEENKTMWVEGAIIGNFNRREKGREKIDRDYYDQYGR